MVIKTQQLIDTKMNDFKLRFAEPKDAGTYFGVY